MCEPWSFDFTPIRNITAIGTIKDNYLGLIDDGSGEAGDDM